MEKESATTSHDCPCGSGLVFEKCCEPYLKGRPAPTAEALMRSRYTAFVVGDVGHLYNTLDFSKRDKFDEAGIRAWMDKSLWIGLKIYSVEQGGRDDTWGEIEFAARFEMDGELKEHFERGRFKKKDGAWYYVDGRVKGGDTIVRDAPKVGRNDPCTCGSGKKFKKCCGK